jgi:uncharacterized membrane protein
MTFGLQLEFPLIIGTVISKIGRNVMEAPIAVVDEKTKANKDLTTIIYALYAVSLVVGITSIVAIVLNYIKKDDVAGTLFESHFRWQIRTFWFGLLWGVIGAITFIVIIGWFILFADFVWFIYRIAKGWLNLNENKPMYSVQ